MSVSVIITCSVSRRVITELRNHAKANVVDNVAEWLRRQTRIEFEQSIELLQSVIFGCAGSSPVVVDLYFGLFL